MSGRLRFGLGTKTVRVTPDDPIGVTSEVEGPGFPAPEADPDGSTESLVIAT